MAYVTTPQTPAYRTRHSKQDIENLQENLLGTKNDSTNWLSQTSLNNRYEKKVLQERRHVSIALMLQKQATRETENKLKSLEMRVHSLCVKKQKVDAQGESYRKKLQKLMQKQSIDGFLIQERQQLRDDLHREQERKEKSYEELKLQSRKLQELSKTVYREKLKKRVSSIKERSEKVNKEKNNLDLSLLEANRTKYLRIKAQENELRDRMRRIEEFKLRRARRNYLQKIDDELLKHIECQKKLEQLDRIQQGRQENLQKTEKLEKESKQVEKMFRQFFATQLI